MIVELLIVVVLVLCNGLLSMSELAVVSSRPARLKVMAGDGNKGAAVALKLAEDPGKFLSSAQVGISLIGVLSGAFSGATLGDRFTLWLAAQGLPAAAASTLGVGSVVVVITYVSLILGELVPKQLALRDAERVAARVAPTMQFIATVAAPLVWCAPFALATSARRCSWSNRISARAERCCTAAALYRSAAATRCSSATSPAGATRKAS